MNQIDYKIAFDEDREQQLGMTDTNPVNYWPFWVIVYYSVPDNCDF